MKHSNNVTIANMSKRRNIGGRYVEVRERSTTAGRKGTIMGNWSSSSGSSSAQYSAGKRGASKTIKQYRKTLDWLGGEDR